MALSMTYGVATAAVLTLVPALSISRANIVASATVAGLFLWVVNFFVFAPVFGWVWFPNGTNPVVQFIAHTFFFGTILGLVLDVTYFERARRGSVR